MKIVWLSGHPLVQDSLTNHRPPRSQVIMTHFQHAGTCQVERLPRQHGEAETPTSNQSPRVAQGRKLLGPTALRTCPFASPLSQVQARLGPGGYCWRSGNEGPQTCLPAACGVAQRGAQHGPSSSTQTQDPREGPSLAGRTTQGLLRGGLTRQAREEAERSRQGVPRGVVVTQAMTIKTRRALGGRQPA